MNALCKLYKYGYLILAMAACLMLASCGKESLDYNHPDVDFCGRWKRFVWDIMLRWGVRWCIPMPRIMKASTS